MEYSDLELYIQIKNGKPHEHPIFADNFREAFPGVDTDNLPNTFARFIRVAQPDLGTYEVYDGVTYEWVDGIVKDVHHVRPMTDEERAIKVKQLEDEANEGCRAAIEFINKALEAETDEKGKSAWLKCLAAYESWSLESIDPITPPYPFFPFKDQDGNWIIP